MSPFFPVMAGGALGAGLRFALSRALPAAPGGWPTATLIANLVGALVMGLLVAWVERSVPNASLRLFLAPGLLGGFTTFSAFSLETVQLMEAGRPALAGAYIVASVVGGLALLALGLVIGRGA